MMKGGWGGGETREMRFKKMSAYRGKMRIGIRKMIGSYEDEIMNEQEVE
jgi:hypothetical protein